MKKNLLTLLVCALALTVFAQDGNVKTAHVKKVRHTTVTNSDMTESEIRLQDQNIIHYFYDINGNVVLQRKLSYNASQSKTYIAYAYDEKNQMIEQIDGSTRYTYSYNEDGNVAQRLKYSSTGTVSETINYEYTEGVLSKETTLNSSGNVSNYYLYKYTDGLLTNREKYNSSDVMSGNTQYTYNDKNQLVEECDTTLRTSGSSKGKPSSAKRYLYVYDEQGRLSQETLQSATVANYEITAWNEKNQYVYIYEGTTEQLTRKETYNWSSSKSIYDIYEHDEYTVSNLYGNDFMPHNVAIVPGKTITSISMSLEKPAQTAGLAGYRVIADNTLLDTLYTTENFDIEGQLKGTHTYRVMAVYDTIPGTVTAAIDYDVVIDLPAPSDAIIESKEYTSSWAASFTFTPPVVPEGVTLTGYRYKVDGGNGGKSGTADATAERIAFSGLWADTKNNENNLCTVYLYAVYAEGESDAYTFELDLRDTNDQILVKWNNERMERTDADGFLLGASHYYYNTVSNAEVLTAQVDYNSDYVPTLRHTTDSKTNIKYVEKWNAETKQWEKYISKEPGKEDGTTWENWYNCVTTKVWDATIEDYVATEVEKVYQYYNSSYKVITGYTAIYDINEGVETLKSYITHYAAADFSLDADTLYAADKTTIVGLIEYRYDATLNSYGSLESRTLTSKTTYKYENGNFIATEIVEGIINAKTGLESSQTVSTIDADGNKTIVENVTFTASKEYGAIKAPASVAFANDTLTWQAPANTYMIPTGYRVFINNIPYTDTYSYEDTSVAIEGIPSGTYTFTVMSLYDGSESNYQTSVEVNYTNYATFVPSSVTPAAYDYELDNMVDALTEVTLTFPTKIATLDAEAVASLNSRFGPVGETTAKVSEDGTALVITMPENLENGMYYLDVPQAMVTAEDGTYNPALSYMFVLQLPLTYDLPLPTVTPEEGTYGTLEGIEKLQFTFDQEVFALEATIGVTGTIYATDVEGQNRVEATIDIEGYDYTKWTVTFAQKITEIGEYVVVVPAATFGDATASSTAYTGVFSTGKVNPEFQLHYTIEPSAVEAVENDVVIRVENRNIIAPEEAKVFSLQGYEVAKENVEPGIYVVVYNETVTKVSVR